MGAGTDREVSEVMLRRALQAADCVDVEIFFFFLFNPGILEILPNNVPERTEVGGGTTAATQLIPMADTTLGDRTPGTWLSTAQMMVWCG